MWSGHDGVAPREARSSDHRGLEQPRFDPHGSTYTWIFFSINRYSTIDVFFVPYDFFYLKIFHLLEREREREKHQHLVPLIDAFIV